MADVESGALQMAVDSAAVGETVRLTSDVTLTSKVTISNVVTLDLNGYVITGNIDDGYGTIYVGTKGALTIVDNSSGQTGGIVNTLGNAIGNYGSVVVYGGTFTGNYALYNFHYSDTIYGTSIIYGGTFKSINVDSPSIANCGYLTVSGGNIESIDTTNSLTITDGSVKSLYIGVADYNPVHQNTSIDGGYISSFAVADDSVNKISISGGTFDIAVDNQYLADGFELAYDESTGSYGVVSNSGDTGNIGLKVIATSSSRVRELIIKNGQLIFIQDKGRIAFDFNDKRVFYNQIIELDTESERSNLLSPTGGYYFIIDTAVLWRYDDGWTQITRAPEEVVFIGVELPELGQQNKLYVNKAEKEISVWDDETGAYIAVSNYTNEITNEDIDGLFN